MTAAIFFMKTSPEYWQTGRILLELWRIVKPIEGSAEKTAQIKALLVSMDGYMLNILGFYSTSSG
jgi:hypothetical protein